MAIFTNKAKNSTSFTNKIANGKGLKWEDANQTWEATDNTWQGLDKIVYVNKVKNTTSFTNKSKN